MRLAAAAAALLIGATGGVVGCDVFSSERACTLIGCSDGLSIRFGQVVPVDVTVTLELPGGATQSQECRTSHFCDGVFFEGVEAESAVVRLTVAGQPPQVEELDDIHYEKHRPNGEGCDPECLIAIEHVKLRVHA